VKQPAPNALLLAFLIGAMLRAVAPRRLAGPSVQDLDFAGDNNLAPVTGGDQVRLDDLDYLEALAGVVVVIARPAR
jgi:hypothetical protein